MRAEHYRAFFHCQKKKKENKRLETDAILQAVHRVSFASRNIIFYRGKND
jgi:hypothetical protein